MPSISPVFIFSKLWDTYFYNARQKKRPKAPFKKKQNKPLPINIKCHFSHITGVKCNAIVLSVSPAWTVISKQVISCLLYSGTALTICSYWLLLHVFWYSSLTIIKWVIDLEWINQRHGGIFYSAPFLLVVPSFPRKIWCLRGVFNTERKQGWRECAERYRIAWALKTGARCWRLHSQWSVQECSVLAEPKCSL